MWCLLSTVIMVRQGVSIYVDVWYRFVVEGGRLRGNWGVPVLEKAPDFAMNSVRAAMPSFVPRMTGRAIDLEALVRMLWCWL